MILLHGSWCPLPDSRYGGHFFLWAETAVPAHAPKRGRTPRLSATTLRPHPGQISARQVRAACQGLAGAGPLPTLPSTAVVWLPSAAGKPQPAPELRLLEREPLPPLGEPFQPSAQGNGAEAVLAAWEVAGVALPAGQVLRLLATLPDSPPEQWSEVVLGSDLRYWSQAAKLALELLARQKYLPALYKDGEGRFRAAWSPDLTDPVDATRVVRLARALPPLCRALRILPASERSRHVTPANLPSASSLLDAFLASAVDGALRQWASSLRRRSHSGPTEVALQWRQALLARVDAADGLPPVLNGPPHQVQALYEQYQGWIAQLAPAGTGAFRICFRLEPPDLPEATPDVLAPTAQSGDWALRFLLQANDDPSLLVPAERVWRESGGVLRYLNRRFEQPQERLLSGLGQASRIFPALERSLETARPEAHTLTTGEAYTFLRESAPLLESAGFGLLVPPWWSKRTARLGLRLQASPAATVSSGLLGLDTLVAYDWQLSLGDQVLSRDEFVKLAALKQPLVRVRGQWVELRAEQVESVLRFMQQQGRAAQGTLGEALRLAQMAGDGDREAPLPILQVEASGWIGDLLQQLAGRERLAPLPQPTGFRGQLRPYQALGVSWLAFLHRWGLGACLADDMGLGKTIQVLALLLTDREQGAEQRPSLLICPMSVVGNWQREAQRFAPGLRVLVHHGSERQSGEDFLAQACAHDLVISTYSLLHRDEEELASVEWDGAILDEAQNVKNPSSRQAQAARKLRARYRVALTGTPVENRLSELWSIMEFLNPGYLGNQAAFRRRFALPIERYQEPAALQKLKILVRPFLLRRVKSDPAVIQDLPDKLEMPVYCKLTAEQATLYQAVVADALQEIEKADGVQRRGMVLAMLLKLKQICNHPAQFLGDRSSLPGRSGKLARLTEMLEEALAAGDRALVFTQFAEMGEMLRQHLQGELHREALFLHGGVPQQQRERMIARFQEEPQGPPIFVLSLKAGGTGLNLMRANHVFHFDRWWNPAVENQATDRAYRIGQTRNVLVHKFTCLGTMEEHIEQLIQSKKALAENVVDAGEGWLTELSTEELREVLELREA